MNYLSVCSGIESASVAWHPLGWQPVGFAEIEKFPSAILAHHYPHVPNFGDMTKFKDWPDVRADILVGGTPCQSFSVAGLRKGMADPRGNLALTYLAIADRYRPEWLLWENVPGVLSSSGGRDFGAFLGGLVELGYGFAYRVLDAQYVRVDGFGRAVPQRRRRVFVVGNSRNWRRAAAVLFERESLSWDSAPRRKAGQGFAADIAPSIVSSGRGVERAGDTRGQDPVVAVPAISHCLNAGGMGRIDYETETMIAHPAGYSASGDGFWRDGVGPLRARPQDSHENLVAHSLRGEGFDASEDGTGRGTPLVPVYPYTLAIRGREGTHQLEYRQDGTANAVLTPNGGRAGIGVGAIAFDCKASGQSGFGIGDVASTMRAMGHADSHTNGGGHQAVAYGIGSDAVDRTGECSSGKPGDQSGLNIVEGVQPSLRARPNNSVATAWAVRRLTPRECERLQGFMPGYTNVPWRGKDTAPDGPRYKALGNSMAVNAMRWIGQRIQTISDITKDNIARDAA